MTPTISAFLQAVGPETAAMQDSGIRLKVMRSDFARGNFPHLKSLNYLPTIMALRTAHRDGCAEALLLDPDGRVLECATSNICMISGDTLTTPPLELGLLAGRTRALIMDLAGTTGLQAREAAFDLQDLQAADEVFICGSVKEVVPVIGLDAQPIGTKTPGPKTRCLQQAYRRAALASCSGKDPV